MQLTRKNKNIKYFIWPIVVAVIAICLSLCWHYFDSNTDNAKSNAAFAAASDVSLHFIDVGQGDCELILDGDKTVLIDGGESDKGIDVVRYLKSLGINKLDIVIATHPHTDHIGGLITVFKNLEVGLLIMPDIPDNLIPTTPTYTNFLNIVSQKGILVDKAKVGKSYEVYFGTLNILGPVEENYTSLNSWSVASRYVYKNTSFLMCGDMERDAEKDLLNSGQNIKSNVFKLNHHGSKTSNTKEFLAAVDAEIYTIEVGKNNKYGHPSNEVIKRLEDKKVYRTDRNGTIIILTDGDKLNVKYEKGSDG